MKLNAQINAWAIAHDLALKSEEATTGKGGSVPALVITADTSAVSALIMSEEWPSITVETLMSGGTSILRQLPGSSGLFRFKLPTSKFAAGENSTLADLLSGAKLLGSNGPSAGECNWKHTRFANCNHTGVYGPRVLEAFDEFREEWTITISEMAITVSEIAPATGVAGAFIPRKFTFDALKQDDSGKSGSVDGFTATHILKILNGLLLEWCKTGTPSKTGRSGTTS